ncbi:PREDICTED: protein TEX261-like [Acropora digitifera]|uniref:protein TEX261-like n=1 Tax=Acropora digitifera TaxID=70779 RepID=UPI00077ADE06|nr:PREDICTED: protein TEX261-like [Acropora digitifera]
MFLYILSWFSMIFHVIFMTLALAAALFYLAELVEEYTVLAAKIIKSILAVTTVIYIGLLILEGFPISMIIAGLFSNGLYFLLLRDFPFIELTSPVFIGGVAMVFVNHYLAFDHFSSVWYPFSEILAYFTICLWILPFAFFVSLSASENVLPTASTASLGEREPNFAYPGQKSSRRHGILALFSFLSKKTEGYLPTRTKTF